MITTKFIAAAVLAAGALVYAPTALAQPLPNPEPVPVPVPEQVVGEEAPVPMVPNEETRVSAPQVGGSESESTGSYVNPMEAGPNINGIPCQGTFESTVCYAEQAGDSPLEVQPRSTLSSSP